MENTFGIDIIPDNDLQRIEVLKRYKILDTPPEGAFDNVARLATKIFQVPISLISLVDAEQVFFKSNIGMGKAKSTPRGHSLCSLAVLKPDVTVFEDARTESCLLSNPNVAGDFGLQFYAGAPITTHDGFLIGTLCIIDKTPRAFKAADQEILKDLAKIVMDEIELRLAAITEVEKQQSINEELVASNEEIAAVNEALTATNEELLVANSRIVETYGQLSDAHKNLQASNLLLAESENRFRIMAESSGILIAVGDETSNATYFSNAWADLTGQSIEDLIEFGWADRVHPEDRDRYVKIYLDAFKIKATFTGEFRILNREGDYRWLYAKGSPRFNTDHTFAGYISSCIDFTEQLADREKLKDSEGKLQLLADNISQLTWMTDETGAVFWYNKRWFDFTGTTYEEMEGTGWETVCHPDHVERVKNKFLLDIATHDVWEDTFPIRGTNGEYRWFLSRAVPLKDDLGKIVRWFGTNTDITERRNDEQLKNDFIGIVSHELKTPLTSMSGYIQMLSMMAKRSGNVTITSTLDKAQKQVAKMGTLINSFLDVTRLEGGKIQINKQPFDMASLMKESEDESAATISSHPVIYAPVEYSPVIADRDKIGQVITNLINNAVKYSSPGTTINVACITKNKCAEIQVKDEGMGIRKEDITKLFDRFYRVDGQSTKSISGFGIGLYLSAEIIKRHNGKIWVESELGKGSTFYFNLPIAE